MASIQILHSTTVLLMLDHCTCNHQCAAHTRHPLHTTCCSESVMQVLMQACQPGKTSPPANDRQPELQL